MLPDMLPDCNGTVKVDTARVCEIPVPQPFDGVTVIVPEPMPTEAVTELVVFPDI